MVVVSEHWAKNVATYCTPLNQQTGPAAMVIGGRIEGDGEEKMHAKALLQCRPNSHPFQERTLSLEQPVKVGRSVARARATSTNAIFDCKVLSRHHALLWYENGKFYLQDTRSSNGTFVNNNRLTAETEHHEVSSGDIVQFGVDVIENNRKVTHGCIIATLKLYLPDGKEAKASPSIVENNTHVVPLDELYKLHQIIQEATQREQCLEAKLMALQAVVKEAKKSVDESWQAYVGEERLLSRVSTLESQLQRASKNWDEDKYREEILKLQESNAAYQTEAKKALEKLHDDHLQALSTATEQERSRISAEQEVILAKEQLVQAQQELEELAQKLTEEQERAAEERARRELEHWELQTRLQNETEMVEKLEAKIAEKEQNDSGNGNGNENENENENGNGNGEGGGEGQTNKDENPDGNLDKPIIYDLKTKEEMLETDPDNWKIWSNGTDDEENHIRLTVCPVAEDENEKGEDGEKEQTDEKLARQDTVTSEDAQEENDDEEGVREEEEEVHHEKRVTFNLPDEATASPTRTEASGREGKDDFEDNVDSKTLKYKYQSAQNELKKKIEILESILETNRLKFADLEKSLAVEKETTAEATERNEKLSEELQLFRQKWKESCDEARLLKERVETLDQSTKTISCNLVSYDQLVGLEEELVVLKQRHSQINEEKLKLQHELKDLRLKYDKLCNSSYDKLYFYVAPLVLMILYLMISAMVS